MPVSAQPFNTKWDIKEDYIFYLEITDDDEVPIDISSWSFHYIVSDSDGNVVWDVLNGDFSRPSTGVITFTKTVADLASLLGLYSLRLLVTKSDAVDDPYMIGLYEFVDE